MNPLGPLAPAGTALFTTITEAPPTTPTVDHDQPEESVAVVKIVSPKIVVARLFKEALTDAELEVVLDHEMAHHARRDNLTRFALECAPAVWSPSEWLLNGLP